MFDTLHYSPNFPASGALCMPSSAYELEAPVSNVGSRWLRHWYTFWNINRQKWSAWQQLNVRTILPKRWNQSISRYYECTRVRTNKSWNWSVSLVTQVLLSILIDHESDGPKRQGFTVWTRHVFCCTSHPGLPVHLIRVGLLNSRSNRQNIYLNIQSRISKRRLSFHITLYTCTALIHSAVE